MARTDCVVLLLKYGGKVQTQPLQSPPPLPQKPSDDVWLMCSRLNGCYLLLVVLRATRTT